ncbi:MAG: hypothetical protein QS721_05145 [Candidatus Endonucleobacter sp. (ex Gigantidas childressi)]|nr:hypothetical protein [Candidatus Endonucleobacter sp. (ex Gigantidas childressi)]
MQKKTFLFLLLLSVQTTAFNSTLDDDSSGDAVREFISLDQKANYEEGSVLIDNTSSTLSYTGVLSSRADTHYQRIGLALMREGNNIPIVIMSTEDGEIPDFETMDVNIPNALNGYHCNQITYQEKASTIIQDSTNIELTGKNCNGKGSNSGLTKKIEIKVTESMLNAGTSEIYIENNNAVLNTERQLTTELFLNGGLGTRAYNQIFDLIKNNHKVTTIIEDQVSGSIHDDINMQTGRLIRNAGLSTHITNTSYVASGGVDLFCSGKARTMEDGAKLLVHSWSGDDIEAGNLPVDSPLHNDQITYFNEMLGSPEGRDFYFFTINAATAADIHEMSKLEIKTFGIITGN